jgi:predicted MPP superfamily phosphohydrolase
VSLLSARGDGDTPPKPENEILGLSRLTRRKFLQLTAAAAVTGGMAISADAAIFEPNRPQLVRIEVPLTRLPAAWDGFTIAQLSDFHYDGHFSVVSIRRAVEVVNHLHPHLVVLTGDFVTVPYGSQYLHNAKQGASAAEPCAQLLGQLHAPFGRVAVLGNHDVGSDPARVIEALQFQGIPVLRNRSMPLEQAGARLWLCGVDDVIEGRPNLDVTVKGIPPNEPVVLLLHEPDAADHVAKYPVDLQLSGHSHGGQVRLPFVGAPFLPDLARKYPWGLRRIGRLTLYTNIGLGTIRVPVRFHCPPEITLFTLRAATNVVR